VLDDATVYTFHGTERFEVLAPLGHGGMGAVYRAHDRERRMDVALKTLLSFNADALIAFKREFRALQDLSHPNLVNIHELFSEGHDWFFTMELVDGIPFLGYVRKEPRRDVSVDAKTVLRLADADAGIGAGWSGSIFDEGRLRACLPQLVLGLDALHAAGKVHRDVKPSNIMVTPTGRVVVLDFGLVTDADRRAQISQQNIVGTVDYMAPEQAAGLPVGPPADFYALGVLLYEALTGIVPFFGTVTEVMMNKQRVIPQSPRSIVSSVPRDLDALCCQLLRIEPKDRPDAATILAALGVKSPAQKSGSLSTSLTSSAPFIGRAAELGVLEEAYEELRAGRAGAVYVVGESGVGKTALVRRFTDHLELHQPETEIQKGRCYEHETVPFKAFDSLFDDVARKLRAWPRDELSQILPMHMALLAQVFPVLRRVEAIADLAPSVPNASNPHEQRSRLFAAVRALFERMAQKSPFVLVLNDLQWADADSIALLREVMRAPSPPILLLGTARGRSPVAEQVMTAVPGRTIALERLPPEQALELATVLVRKVGGSAPLDPAAIAAEAGGHPQFIDELVRYAGRNGLSSSQSLQLDEAIWARLLRIEDPTTRRLLEIVSVAASPLVQETAAVAAGIATGDFLRHLRMLRTELFVRTQGTRATDSIEPYHDRIRTAVVKHLDGNLVRAHHRRIALALEMGAVPDPAALTVHWLEAAEPERARHYAERAAERAEAALAFDRAAQFYELCIRLAPPGGDVRALRVRLADAQVNAGRGADAAAQYLLASASSDGGRARTIADLDLERRAAEQFLRSGHIDDGLRAIRNVLSALDMEMPTTTRGALASLLYHRARVRLRGFGWRPRTEHQLTREQLARIDLCWAVSAGLANVDPIRGADFQTRQLRLALDAGEPTRVIRALGAEAGYLALRGGAKVKRTAELVRMTRDLAQRIGDPQGLALAAFVDGCAAFLQGRWRDGVRLAREAEQMLRRDGSGGMSWETDTARFVQLWSAFYCGETALMFERVPELAREAEARGDVYAVTNLKSAFLPIMLLVRNHPDRALGEAELAVAEWSRDRFHVQHYNALCGSVMTHLYAGEHHRALEELERSWSALEDSKLLFVEQMNVRVLHLRGCVHAALAATVESERVVRGRQAFASARMLRGLKSRWAMALGTLLEAGTHAALGQVQEATATLRDAVIRLDAADMPLYASAARRRLGVMIGGEEGMQLVSAADTVLREAQVALPARFSAMLAPGFGP